MTQDGFPHSDIHGSKVVCTSPWLIAAYHVLLRLHVPRHSPYALSSFTKRFFSVEFDYLHQSHCQKAWLVELAGIEPTTFPTLHVGTLYLHRIGHDNGSNSTNFKITVGGASRDRTDDLLRAKQALSQLSYSPIGYPGHLLNVGLRGLEPRTSSLSGMRSNHLSYKPKYLGYAWIQVD